MKNEYVQDGVPFLRSQNVRPLRFDESGMVYIPPSFDSKLSKSRLYGGELLVTRSGANTGDCCVYPADAPQANCADLVITRPLSILNAYYAAIFVCSPDGEAHLRRGETGIAQPHFNTKAMRTTPLPLPPLAEQCEIVRRVDGMMQIINHVENRLDLGLRNSERITQSVLAKAFAGELVETDAELAAREGREYEPASALLERIQASTPKKTKRRTRKKNVAT
jgi:type I restriction enzyme S subunit